MLFISFSFFFFFNDTATTEIYTLSLHDALPISGQRGVVDAGDRPQQRRGHGQRDQGGAGEQGGQQPAPRHQREGRRRDRKSTRLNSSHLVISYAVFCLKKKKDNDDTHDDSHMLR